jgi:hypothetical protein
MSDQSWTRADWARWFVFHDEPDEAARILEPGDELELGRSDSLDLVAAIGRRGLSAAYDGQRVSVSGDATSRKPPQRAAAVPAARAKKTA